MDVVGSGGRTPNLRTETLDFRGFDSIRILSLRGGVLMSIGDFPETLSQEILAGRILVGRLGVAPSSRQLSMQTSARTGFNYILSSCLSFLPCFGSSMIILNYTNYECVYIYIYTHMYIHSIYTY